MRAHVPVLCLLLASFILAGCTTTETPRETANPADSTPTVDPATNQTEPPVSTAFDDCFQFHTMFTARAEDFQVPAGYTIRSDEAGLATLYAVPTICSERAALVISLPVDPPADRVVPNHNHHFAVELYADEDTAGWLEAEGISAVTCGCHLDFFSDLHPVFHMDGGGHSYTARFVITPSSGPFTESPIAYFTGNGDGVILQSQGNATNLGLGDVLVQYSGPGGAPPASLGNIAHAVHGLAFTWGVQ